MTDSHSDNGKDSKIAAELRQLGALHEIMQDDIKKLLEIMSAQQESITKIPKMAERVEKLEYDSQTTRLAVTSTNHDLKIIKIRTEKLEGIADQLKDHEARINSLESKTA